MKEKLTVNVLFSGVGCQEQGIKDTGLFDLDVISTSDIDKEAILSYACLHCDLTEEMVSNYTEYPSREEMVKDLVRMNVGYDPKKNKAYDWTKTARKKSNDIEKYWLACKLSNQKGDISKIESLPYADLWTISFCCQDISVSGKMKGFKPDSGTRSSLLWENIRLLKDAVDRGESPKYLMFENVKNLVGKNFIDDFNKLLDVINDLGFNSYWKVINAKDCGVPQNRERVFVICIHKDIDKGKFEFPKPFNTGIRLKDILEKDVDEKYYLSENIQKRFKITDETMTKSIIGTTISEECTRFGQRDVVYQENCTIGALTATDYKQPKQILEITSEPFIVASRGRYSNENESNETYQNFEPRTDGLTNTITTVQKDNYIVNTNRCIQVGDLQHYGYDEMNRVYSKEGLCPKLRTMTGGDRQPRFLENVEPRIRKLTPCECWKLTGWIKEYFIKAKNIGISDSSLYKQAGNGIVTNCVELIFEHFYKAQYNENFECTDENFTQPQVD